MPTEDTAAPGPLPDLASALLLLVIEVPAALLALLALGLRGWAAQRPAAAGTAAPPSPPFDWTPWLVYGGFALALLLVIVLSARSRLRITPVVHGALLIAMVALIVAGLGREHRTGNRTTAAPLRPASAPPALPRPSGTVLSGRMAGWRPRTCRPC